MYNFTIINQLFCFVLSVEFTELTFNEPNFRCNLLRFHSITYQFFSKLPDCLVRIFVGMGVNVSFVSCQSVKVEHGPSSVDGDNSMSRFRGVMRRYSPIFLIPIKVSNLLFLGPTIATTTSLVVDVGI